MVTLCNFKVLVGYCFLLNLKYYCVENLLNFIFVKTLTSRA